MHWVEKWEHFVHPIILRTNGLSLSFEWDTCMGHFWDFFANFISRSYRTVCHGGAHHLHYIIKGTDLYSITILYNWIEQKPLYISPSRFNFLNPNSFVGFIYIFQPLGSDFSNWNLRRLVTKVVYASLIVIFMVY